MFLNYKKRSGKYTPKGWDGGHSQGAFTLNPRPLFFVQYYSMPVTKVSQPATPLVEGAYLNRWLGKLPSMTTYIFF